jgi:hypothetical protein
VFERGLVIKDYTLSHGDQKEGWRHRPLRSRRVLNGQEKSGTPSPEISLLQQQEKNSGHIGGVQRRPDFLILTVALCLNGSLEPNNFLKVHQIKPSEELLEGPGYRDGIRARPNGRELDLSTRLR